MFDLHIWEQTQSLEQVGNSSLLLLYIMEYITVITKTSDFLNEMQNWLLGLYEMLDLILYNIG